MSQEQQYQSDEVKRRVAEQLGQLLLANIEMGTLIDVQRSQLAALAQQAQQASGASAAPPVRKMTPEELAGASD